MQVELEQLLILQDRAQKIRQLEAELRSLPLERKSLDSQVAAASANLEATKDRARHVEVRTGQSALLENDPDLATVIRSRLPYIDPLNHLQIELIRRRRRGDDAPDVRDGIHLTINGVAAGLRNTG